MMVNLRDTQSESLSGEGGIYLYKRIGSMFQLILYERLVAMISEKHDGVKYFVFQKKTKLLV